jgi:hypothetical protein
MNSDPPNQKTPFSKTFCIMTAALVLVVFVVLLVWVISPFLKSTATMRARQADVEHAIEALALLVFTMRHDESHIPEMLDDVRITSKRSINETPDGVEFIDRWKTPYKLGKSDTLTWQLMVNFSQSNDNRLTIASAGPDKAFGTSDDIVESFIFTDQGLKNQGE